METFIDKCVAGNAFLFEIHDYVDRWHKSDTMESLHDYLGLTFLEYATWINDPDSLELVVNEKKQKKV